MTLYVPLYQYLIKMYSYNKTREWNTGQFHHVLGIQIHWCNFDKVNMILDVAYNAIIFCDKRGLHEHEHVYFSYEMYTWRGNAFNIVLF